MARTKHRRSRAGTAASSERGQLSDEMRAHLARLGVSTVAEYRRWCADRGFARNLAKSVHARRAELDHHQKSRAHDAAQRARKRRHPGKALRSALTDDQVLDALPRSLKRAASCGRRIPRQSRVHELLDHVDRVSGLLDEVSPYDDKPFGVGVVALAERSCGWLRPVERWQPRTHNAGRQFSSLARHLLARYDVPEFMDRAWFEEGESARSHRSWFEHVGAGKNLRTARLPIACTKRIAHHVLEAPADHTFEEALRYGQVLALVGNPQLAEAIRGTRLTRSFTSEEFWLSVIRWFIANPMLSLAHVGPILDYLHDQRFVGRPGVVDGVARDLPPPQPNLTMKGRDPEALLRQVDRWHGGLNRRNAGVAAGPPSWRPTGLPGFKLTTGSKKAANLTIWVIRELATLRDLRHEGAKMQHCVVSYHRECARGNSAIFALERHDEDGLHKHLTLEVVPERRLLVQARGKANRIATDAEMNVVQRWLEHAKLKRGQWL